MTEYKNKREMNFIRDNTKDLMQSLMLKSNLYL